MRWSSLLLVAAGCSTEIFEFDASQSARTVLPGQVEGFDPVELDPSLFEDSDEGLAMGPELLEQFDVQKADVSDITVTSLTLAAVAPGSADLSFLDAVEIWISAEGQPDLLLTSYAEFAEGDVTVDLPVDDSDLAPYLFAEGGALVTTLPTGFQPPVDTTLETTLGVSIGVTVEGALGLIR